MQQCSSPFLRSVSAGVSLRRQSLQKVGMFLFFFLFLVETNFTTNLCISLTNTGTFVVHTHVVFHFFLVFRCEQRHVEIHRKREREPAFVRVRFRGQRLEQAWHRFAEVLHV